jgi:2-oxoglutarate ferredoxin oxidoreductase subunit alpha
MSEFIGYGYFAEIPAVIWDIQRMGPSTGLPTRTSQGDFRLHLGHGDGRRPVLLPADPTNVSRWQARRLIWPALQTPVFVLSDLDIGMNLWITGIRVPGKPLDRGKVLMRS